jgi:hypothetical protein
MLLSISLPASTELLEYSSFEKCKHLEAVHFEDGSKLQRIECESFTGCESLRLITLPKSVEGREGVDLSGVNGIDVC